ncbi:MAG TPA: YciI family protein [Candidatus Acidoferrales bacterium]|nr:YciI family protein [Candidatus Acidoferrales bacterium]
MPRYLLTFYAVEDEWMALPEAERNTAIGEIGAWFGEHARAGKILDGHRLGRGTKTVRHGRVRKKDLPMVSDGPFAEAKETVGSYALVEVADEAEAIEIAKRWPAGGIVEVRPVAE